MMCFISKKYKLMRYFIERNRRFARICPIWMAENCLENSSDILLHREACCVAAVKAD